MIGSPQVISETESKLRYFCQHPKCDKNFTRKEHLSRHELNHNPKVLYKCQLPECGKSFVRNDLLKRHIRRHELRRDKFQRRNNKAAVNFNNTPVVLSGPGLKTSHENSSPSEIDAFTRSSIDASAPVEARPSISEQGNLKHGASPTNGSSQPTQARVTSIPQRTTLVTPKNDGVRGVQKSTSSGNLLSWLFDDLSSNDNNIEPAMRTRNDFSDFMLSEDMLFQEAPGLSGGFAHINGVDMAWSARLPPITSPLAAGLAGNENTNDSTAIDNRGINAPIENSPASPSDNVSSLVLNDLLNVIPSLSQHPDFTGPKIDFFLFNYWSLYHPAFPILHKPSFSSSRCEPLLLLCMLMIGAHVIAASPSGTAGCHFLDICDPRSLADCIAEPVRWALFTSPDFHPPAKLYVIQSLLLLEWYEKNCSTRRIHERGHLHHGTTINLLRRTPSLGGNPLKSSQELEPNEPETVYSQWLEMESMKRATLMCFYMDAVDAISFGHQLVLHCHQIQLTMPCDDALWEAPLPVRRIPKSMPFLLAMKSTLNRTSFNATPFGRRMVLAGLCAILFQMQQLDLQSAIGLEEGMHPIKNWREVIMRAFTFWRNELGESKGLDSKGRPSRTIAGSLANGSSTCTSPYGSLCTSSILERLEADTSCKHPVFHMAYVFMSISHFDLTTFAGAPWRMNVRPSDSDRAAVNRRVKDWARSLHGRIAVIHCYLMLFELFLSPEDGPYEYNHPFDPNSDLFCRSNILALLTVVIWNYNYAVDGAESNILFGSPDKKLSDITPVENGYAYLRRIRKELSELSGVMIHTKVKHISGDEFFKLTCRYADLLPKVRNKQNMSGLCVMVSSMLMQSSFALPKELAKLLNLCAERSLGSPRNTELHMYDQ
ncbi:BA75_00464T0 [Komagataella pastoris]|uniref:BA75_00464T0 n=1 Tax=Komagataella pastoris TaxID=4922 RepID=A0A1B2J6P8_PICPA|nr:BA75_00464T0 [Komagataella pastoris]